MNKFGKRLRDPLFSYLGLPHDEMTILENFVLFSLPPIIAGSIQSRGDFFSVIRFRSTKYINVYVVLEVIAFHDCVLAGAYNRSVFLARFLIIFELFSF